MRVFNRDGGMGALLALALVVSVSSADVASQDCLDCHGDDEDIGIVTEASFEGSVHEGFECTDCHSSIDDLPHDDVLPAATCGDCHEGVANGYTRHGRSALGQVPDLPTCTSCHGSHAIFYVDDERSPAHPDNLGATCDACHGDVHLAREHDIRLKRPVDVYKVSVHGMASDTTGAAGCINCHGTEGSAHEILSPGNARSSINHFNIPTTCGQCHERVTEEYLAGVHGKLVLRGETDSPVCTQCHGEHGILAPSDPRSRVSTTRVAQSTCEPCHESALLDDKYGLPAGESASFIDSYHGLKSSSGDPTVANCASCHGNHLILPSSDPRSSVNTANLTKTCGYCHPGINEALARTQIHGATVAPSRGAAHIVAIVYTILIALVIGGMGAYVVLDFTKQVQNRRRGLDQVVRMDANARFQHGMLFVTFVVLVITGFALRYSELWLFQKLFSWDGGFQARGVIHRVAASVFVFSCVWHMVFLFTRSGRRFGRDMSLSVSDGEEFRDMVLYNLDRRPSRPRSGRFGFVEKAEYWALVWGSVIMSLTGVALWFDNWAVSVLSSTWLDVMRVVHFYEALLATLAIAVWHLYAVVFSPAVYPGNPAVFTGKMPRKMLEHEHPDDPALRDQIPPVVERRRTVEAIGVNARREK
jgi:cytochrome b subunit of formate dehydrogenase